MTTEDVVVGLSPEALGWGELEPGVVSHATGVVRDQGFMTSWDGTRLFWRAWRPTSGVAKARIILQHGYGEHSGRYDHVGVALVRAGYEVAALEARGHGRSEGPRAHVPAYDDYVRDLERFVPFVALEYGEAAQTFGFGHSNGGLIMLRWALRRPREITGFVVTSPMCGFAVKVPVWKAKAGRALSKVWPTFSLPTELPASGLTHDQRVVEAYEKDPLVLSIATAGWFEEAKAAQADLLARASRIEHPLLMLLGGADPIVDPAAAEAVYHHIHDGDRELEIYTTLYHEILNEPEWPDILHRALLWMEAHRAPVAASSDEQE